VHRPRDRRRAAGTADGRACSALDPISTLAIEDLIQTLKEKYTIVIVTHNMQQAARVSERTAFFNLAAIGKPASWSRWTTPRRSLQPERPAHRGLHLRPLRLRSASGAGDGSARVEPRDHSGA